MRRPPFLAMRVIADGPGRNYLRDACGKHGVDCVLCQFKSRPTQFPGHAVVGRPKKGIFNVTSYENRLKMEREETSFVLHAFLFDPPGQALASVKNWGDELFIVYLDDPLNNPHYYLTNDYWSTTTSPG